MQWRTHGTHIRWKWNDFCVDYKNSTNFTMKKTANNFQFLIWIWIIFKSDFNSYMCRCQRFCIFTRWKYLCFVWRKLCLELSPFHGEYSEWNSKNVTIKRYSYATLFWRHSCVHIWINTATAIWQIRLTTITHRITQQFSVATANRFCCCCCCCLCSIYALTEVAHFTNGAHFKYASIIGAIPN